MARSVADAARVLDVIAGYDPADPVTDAVRDLERVSYVSYLDPEGLRGARIGVLRQLSNRRDADSEVLQRFEQALDDLRASGATIVDPLTVPELDGLVPPVEGASLPVWCSRFRYDLESYLESLGDRAPVRTLAAIVESGLFHPHLEADLQYYQRQAPPAEDESCIAAEKGRAQLRTAVRALIVEHNLDALAYPTWSNPPRLIGDLNSPHGDNSQHVSPHTGFPAITVPMGYVRDGLPVGLQLVGDAYTEGKLISLAYAYEQATHHRRPPSSTPPID